jgi:hypothetical protein
LKKYSILLICLIFNAVSFAQFRLDISYGESIKIRKIEPSTKFQISSSYGTISLKGSEINNFKFEKPGTYFIRVKQTKSDRITDCDTFMLPSEIQVNVSRVRVNFEQDKIQFSKPIKKGVETNGTTLSVPILIETYDNKPILLNYTTVKTTGIGTSVRANLTIDYGELSVGEHIISYSLNGMVTENAYIMFDFIDANSKIQSISLKSPIED